VIGGVCINPHRVHSITLRASRQIAPSHFSPIPASNLSPDRTRLRRNCQCKPHLPHRPYPRPLWWQRQLRHRHRFRHAPLLSGKILDGFVGNNISTRYNWFDVFASFAGSPPTILTWPLLMATSGPQPWTTGSLPATSSTPNPSSISRTSRISLRSRRHLARCRSQI
jgi:hypothetical protein